MCPESANGERSEGEIELEKEQTVLGSLPITNLRVFISCIPNYIDHERLKSMCSKFDAVDDFFYLPDKAKGDRGFAMVRFATPSGAPALVQSWSQQMNVFPGQIRPVHAKMHHQRIDSLEGVFEKVEYTKPVTAWQEHETVEGYKYYHNVLTEETVWEKPQELMSISTTVDQLNMLNRVQSNLNNELIQQNAQQMQVKIPTQPVLNATCGPPGCNLFIFHIPNSWNDDVLRQIFSPFGRLVAARIQYDPITGAHKGYGFVSYDNTQSTLEAIKSMQGFDTQAGKHLQVSIKKGEEDFNREAVNLVNAQRANRAGLTPALTQGSTTYTGLTSGMTPSMPGSTPALQGTTLPTVLTQQMNQM